MSKLRYLDRELSVAGDESVLECLLRHDVNVSSSCRSGICQSCLVQGGSLPPNSAQKGLKSALVQRRFFLACQCRAAESPEIVAEDVLPTFSSRVLEIVKVAPAIFRVFIERPDSFEFQSGQFINVARPDGLVRPYSIASCAGDKVIELHVARVHDGEMSTYLTQAPGVPVELRGPLGECVYSGQHKEALLLVGTGTGLAPLLGVLRSALLAAHQGPISLIHGATRVDDLYLRSELLGLEKQHANLHYKESVFNPSTQVGSLAVPSAEAGDLRFIDVAELLKRDYPKLVGHRVYLCGHPDLVRTLKKHCFLAGASMAMIHSDPFVSAHPVS